jgi:hypothetical protein
MVNLANMRLRECLMKRIYVGCYQVLRKTKTKVGARRIKCIAVTCHVFDILPHL